MATNLSKDWISESIPDSDFLFMWGNKKFLTQIGAEQGEIPPQIFREHNGSMSTFWEKYCSAGEAKLRAKGMKSELRIKLARIASWAIPITL